MKQNIDNKKKPKSKNKCKHTKKTNKTKAINCKTCALVTKINNEKSKNKNNFPK